MVPSTTTTTTTLPRNDERTDSTLRAELENATLSPSHFTHREHLRLAWGYLAEEADFAVAAIRFRSTLRGYTRAVGAADKYHETITWAYLALVREAMEGRVDRDSSALLAAHPELLDHRRGALARVFDVPALMANPLARRILVLPRTAT
jgi:hypothetical protein